MSKTYKKTRRKYTYREKMNILREFKNSKCSMIKFAKIKNIPLKTLRNWIKNKKQIMDTNINFINSRRIGSGRKPILGDEFENTLFEWFVDVRSEGIPITDNLIITKAKYLNKTINMKCNFSNGWIDKFKKRYFIVSRKGGNTIVRNNDCEKKVIDEFINKVNKKIKSGKYHSIINIDEICLFYDPPINFTLEEKGKKSIEIKTTGRNKQRITILLGIDYMDNIKIKPFIIFKGTTYRCINNILLNEQCTLSYQNNAWCNENQFIKFLSLLPVDKKILLICDNFKGHCSDKVINFIKKNLPLTKLLLLPSNTTSILQPLDVGINKPFKSFIKKNIMNG